MNSKLKKTLKFILIGLGVLVFVLYIVFRFFMDMKMSDAKIEEYFSKEQIKPSFHFYETEGHQMFYTDIGDTTKPTIVFVHGSPGSWDAFAAYFKDPDLLQHFRMISMDRTGYGKSSPGKPESSLWLQSALIKPILDQIPDSIPTLIVGHSFGGPIAYRMAMDYPDQVDALLILAGLADPEHESRPFFLYPLRSKWLRWLLPPDMDASNREILPLKQELYKMEDDNMWEKITANTIIIQGNKDILVSMEHADYAEKMMVNAPVEVIRMPEENHFIPRTQFDLVKENIFKLYEKIH